jgi:hypothetical protein
MRYICGDMDGIIRREAAHGFDSLHCGRDR